MLEVKLNDDITHKYPDGSSWEIDDGRLIISDENGDECGCYSAGRWIFIRKVSE